MPHNPSSLTPVMSVLSQKSSDVTSQALHLQMMSLQAYCIKIPPFFRDVIFRIFSAPPPPAMENNKALGNSNFQVHLTL